MKAEVHNSQDVRKLKEKELDNLRKECRKLEKLRDKMEDNDIFDPDMDKKIEDIYDKIAELESELETE